MLIYTVLRHINNKTIPLKSFDSPDEAEKWAELQMKFLDKDWFYSIAVWETELAPTLPCKDKRLRLIKG